MTVLRTTYNLPFDTLVEAKVEATNEYGYGDLSPANTAGAKIQVEPSIITSLARGSSTSQA